MATAVSDRAAERTNIEPAQDEQPRIAVAERFFRLRDLMAYKQKRDARRREAPDHLSRLSEELEFAEQR